jgi:hypothetical protein
MVAETGQGDTTLGAADIKKIYLVTPAVVSADLQSVTICGIRI